MTTPYPPARFVLTTCVVMLAGCTTIKSRNDAVGVAPDRDAKLGKVGLHYFLPKALVTIEGKSDPAAPDGFVVTVSEPKLVADERYRYRLRWTSNPLYTDKTPTPVAVGANGLLTSVDVSATDETPGILNDLANTTINVFKIMSGGVPQSGVPGKPAKKLKPFRFTFDPLDVEERDRVISSLDAFGIEVQISSHSSGTQGRIGEALAGNGGKTTKGGELAQDPQSGGIFYHPPTTVDLRFDFTPMGGDCIHRETIVVPDTSRVASFAFGRSFMVKRDTKLTLVNGMPSSFTLDRPSPVKGLTAALSTVTGTVAAGIPSIINVRLNRQINAAQAETELLTAQTNLVKAQLALIAEQAKLPVPGAPQSGTPDLRPGQGNQPTGPTPNALHGGHVPAPVVPPAVVPANPANPANPTVSPPEVK